MPIIQSAKKKLRKDKTRTIHNAHKKDMIKGLIKKMRKEPSVKSFSEVSSALDKAVKTNYIHANKSARIKSRLSKLLTPAK